jgi:hypothetical protein
MVHIAVKRIIKTEIIPNNCGVTRRKCRREAIDEKKSRGAFSFNNDDA